VSTVPYGYQFTINPASDFAENETVSVSAFNCQDVVGNTMTTDNWTFTTADSAPPYVNGESPSNDQTSALTQNVILHVKDDGSGVDIANTVLFVNGVYYTNTGGAGSVTTNGTKITFASSLNFNGTNYVGDTTSRTGTTADYTFTIDPQADFTAGEAVPVIVYSRDLSGNLMERVVYAFNATGSSSSCPAGSTFCGSGTSFNGSQCVASGSSVVCASGSSQVGGGTPTGDIAINEPTVAISQVDETSFLVTWTTNIPGSSKVVYDVLSSQNGEGPEFGYRFSSPEDFVSSTVHSVVVKNLAQGQVYFLRPVSQANRRYASGLERVAVAKYRTEVVTQTELREIPGPVTQGTLVCPNPVIIPRPIPSGPVSPRPTVQVPPSTPPVPLTTATVTAPVLPEPPATRSRRKPTILNVRKDGKRVIISGDAEPLSVVYITIY
jgi:hypothetical protein